MDEAPLKVKPAVQPGTIQSRTFFASVLLNPIGPLDLITATSLAGLSSEVPRKQYVLCRKGIRDPCSRTVQPIHFKSPSWKEMTFVLTT